MSIYIGTVNKKAHEGADELFLRTLEGMEKNDYLKNLLPAGTKIIFMCGTPPHIVGTTNSLQLREM